MDRLFLDANILFSAAYRPGSGLLRLWQLKDVLLCSSRYALEEARINLSEEDQRTRLTKLSATLRLFDAHERKLPRGVSRCPRRMSPLCLQQWKRGPLIYLQETFDISDHI
jgi:uncharacterized protein